MVHDDIDSSQGNQDRAQNSILEENPTSSPQLPSKQSSGKRKQPPTVTPKRFTRFFTPRSSLDHGAKISASRQALRDITASAANRTRRRTPTKDNIQIFNDGYIVSTEVSKRRRRVGLVSPDTTPDRSSPLKRIRKQFLELSDDSDTDIRDGAPGENIAEFHCMRKQRRNWTTLDFLEPIAYSRQRGPLGRLLRQETGDYGPRYQSADCGNTEWQHETANFMTRSEDTHACLNPVEPLESTIPFCATSCNCKW